MQLFSSNPSLIGLEIASSKLRVAIINHEKGIFQIEDLVELSFDPANVNPLYKDIPAKILKKAILASSLESKEVLIRQLDLPLIKESDLLSAVEFQVEPLLPYPIESGITQYFKTHHYKTGSLFTILSAKKERLSTHLRTLNAICEPEVISCHPIALASIFNHFFYQKDPTLVLHLGDQQATLVLLEEGNLLASRSFECPNPDSDIFFQELCKATYSIEANFKNKDIYTIYLLGPSFRNRKFALAIEEATQKRTILPSSALLSEEKLHHFALAIGIALSAYQPKVNFRQKEFDYPHPWKREKKGVALYFAGALTLACALFAWGQLKISEQQESLKNQYIELIAKEGKPINQEAFGEMGIDDIQSQLYSLEKEIKSHPESYALLPGVPKVSDILAWVSTHPQIAASIDSKDAPIRIEGFHYTLTKHPDLSHRKERYQLKIDLDFSALNPSIARALHDALLAPNPIVDPKFEVQWTSSKGKYRASFYVKDKTRYS